MLERLRRAKGIHKVVVATSSEKEDDPLAELCLTENVHCFRGDLEDVLDRVFHAAKPYEPDSVLRLTGDCPLIDPEILEDLIDFFTNGEFDYASNTLRPTWPDGLDAELFNFQTLEDAWRNAVLASEREHVTPYIYKRPGAFKLGSFESSLNLSHHRWTVDYEEDFELVRRIYEALYRKDPNFTTARILAWLRANPEAAVSNGKHFRNDGYLKSLLEDGRFQ